MSLGVEKNGSKKFNYSNPEEMLENFGIQKFMDSPGLAAWLASPATLTESEKTILEERRQELAQEVDIWNEQELIVEFLADVFKLAKLKVPGKIRPYYNRPLSGKVGEYEISVVVDCLVATPTLNGRPQKPYFFLEEFKRTRGDSHVPEGQMLAGMLLARTINGNDKPVYGAYLQGAVWRFTMLDKGAYHVSRNFDATRAEDLHQIVGILQGLKALIL